MLNKVKIVIAVVLVLSITSTVFVFNQWQGVRQQLAEANMALKQSEQRSEQLLVERDRLTAAMAQAALERDTERRRLQQARQALESLKTEQAIRWKNEVLPDDIKNILNNQ